MDDDLKEALDELQALHAAVWTHFDPTMEHDDEKHPPEIRKALTEARKFARKHGYVFEGWER